MCLCRCQVPGLGCAMAFGFCCSNIAASTQQHHSNNNSSIAAATPHHHCNNSSKNIEPTGGKCTNSWAIRATNSQSLVIHMVSGPWGPKTHGIHNFPCVFNDKQTYLTLPKGSQELPPKCSLGPLPGVEFRGLGLLNSTCRLEREQRHRSINSSGGNIAAAAALQQQHHCSRIA